MSMAEIQKMSVQEKLTTMEQIWESLKGEDSTLKSPDWHEAVLVERKKKMESGEAKFLTIEQLRERYR